MNIVNLSTYLGFDFLLQCFVVCSGEVLHILVLNLFLSYTTVNGHKFFLFSSSLLICRRAIDFLKNILILYTETLINSFNSFLDSLGFFIYIIMLPACKDGCSNLCALVFFLTILAKTSSAVLNRSGEGQHLFIIPDFRGESIVFHHCM